MADPQLTDYDVLAPSQQGPIPPAVSMPGDKDTVKLPSQSDVQNYLTKRQQQTDTATQRMEDLDKRQLDLAMKPTPHVPVPKYQNIPQAPQDNYRSVFKESQAGLIFATIMGAVASRKHGLGAMQAATGYMEGFHKGDKEKMDRERQKWEDNVTAIKEQNAIEKERYDAVWNNAQLSMHDKQAQIQALAASFGHQQVIDALRAGNMDLAIKIPTDVYNASQKIHAGSPQSIALQRYLQENPNATPQQIMAFVQSGRAGRSAITMYMNRYMEEHPDATSEDIKTAVQKFTVQTNAQNRFLSGPQGNTIRSLNVVVSHLQTMQDLGGALKNGDLVAFNRAAQAWAEQTGKSAPTNFEAAKQIVGAEIIKALGVAGAGTQSERQEASDAFNRARSPEQLAGAIETARKLLIGQLKGLKQQYVASTGLPASSFDDMLSPETRQFFDDDHPGNMSDDDLKKKLGIP